MKILRGLFCGNQVHRTNLARLGTQGAKSQFQVGAKQGCFRLINWTKVGFALCFAALGFRLALAGAGVT
jgi:hypothetical protein